MPNAEAGAEGAGADPAPPPVPEKPVHWKSDNFVTEKKFDGIVNFQDGKIEGYEIDRLLRGGFYKVRAPVFADRYVKTQTMSLILTTLLIAAYFTVTHKNGWVIVDASLVGQSATIFAYFSGLSGFLFGFFVFDALGTYANVKNNCIGGFMGAFADLCLVTSAWLPGTDKKTVEFKETVVRWGMACFWLTCGAADVDVSEDQNVERCVAKELLTKKEAEMIKQMGSNSVVPLLWILDSYEPVLAKLPSPTVKGGSVELWVMNMRSGMGGALVAVSSAGLAPLPLVHLMSLLVKLQLVLLALKEGIFIANVVVGETPGKTPQVLFSLTMVFFTPIVLQGLLEFVIQIRNPFGSDWVDFPLKGFYRDTRDEMFKWFKTGETASTFSATRAVKGLPKREIKGLFN